MKIVVRPTVDPNFQRMNGLQRAAESFRYVLLRWEHWVSPRGDIREWLRRNSYASAWLLIPAIFVMPIVGLILWQVIGLLSMFASIAAKLIVLPVLVLCAYVAIRIVAAVFKR